MISHKRPLLLATIGAGLFALTTSAPALSRADRDVQDLANFSKLLRLGTSADSRATGKYFSRVASTYRKAGYPRTATAFSRAGALGRLGTSTSSTFLPRAKDALRRVRTAVKKENYVRLPSGADLRIPHYHRIAETFVQKADRAVKNLAAGRDVLTGLRKVPRPAWVTFLPASSGGTLVLEGGSQWGTSAGTFTGVTIDWSSVVETTSLPVFSTSTQAGNLAPHNPSVLTGGVSSQWAGFEGGVTFVDLTGTLQIVDGILQPVAVSFGEQSDESPAPPPAD